MNKPNFKNILNIILGICLLIFSIFLFIKKESNFEIILIVFILILSILFIIRGLTSIIHKKPFFPLDFLTKPAKVKEPIITVDEYGIKCKYPSQNKEENIHWEKITQIEVITTDEGPFICDVFITLIDINSKGVVIPQENENCQLIIDRIFELPKFDYKTFTKAMSSTENNSFIVWRK